MSSPGDDFYELTKNVTNSSLEARGPSTEPTLVSPACYQVAVGGLSMSEI